MAHKLLPMVGLVVCLAALPRVAGAQIALEGVAGGLEAPVAFVQVPAVPAAQVILEHAGRVRLLLNGAMQPEDFLDLRSVVKTGDEWGLLGLAFPADYGASRRVFVNFIDLNGNTVVARFTATDDVLHPDPGTRFDLVWPGGTPYISQPDTPMHKGGHMAFGPDSYLYIGLGDGEPGDDPAHRAQDPMSLLGKMLRIDVSVGDDDPEGYDVPASNPFAGRGDVLGEIWAFGLRNPWRWSFDDPWGGNGTGALVLTDVGQDQWEEIDYEPAGAGGRNYGWRNREGAHDHLTDRPSFGGNLTDPTFEYSHEMGRSVIGGFVYRGTLLGPEYQGKYFFADYMTGGLYALDLDVDPQTGEATVTALTEFANLGFGAVRPSSFGVDTENELYLVGYAYGTISRLILATPGPGDGGQCGTNGTPCANTKTWPVNGAVEQPTNLTLSWSVAASATGYEYCVDITNDGDCGSWAPAGNTLSVGLTGLAPGTTYYWQVRTVGPNGMYAYADASRSAFWSFTTGTGAPVLSGDFNGDGKSDILWQHTDGSTGLWLMNGLGFAGGGGLRESGTGWSAVQIGDFNGDGKSDIVWQHTDGSSALWLMNGMSFTSGSLLGAGTGWSVRQVGDLNGDGMSDILWQHTDGSTGLWLMNGLGFAGGGGLIGAGTGWSVWQIGDFNGDGKSDIVWHHTDGSSAVWLMSGLSLVGGGALVGAGTGWTVGHIGDFNGDGKSDIVWQHTDGSTWLWLMNGSSVAGGGGLIGAGTGWSAVQIGDFSGDGKSDFLWQHTDGSSALWLMDGLSLTGGGALVGAGTGWTVRQTGDFNGDGMKDLIMGYTDGSVEMWLMNGVVATSFGGLLGPGTGWSPVP